MIKFKDVTKKFGNIVALNNISFVIEPAEFVFLIGPSGAGKTTLIKLILKEYSPSSGTIEIEGTDLQKIRKRKISEYRRKIGMAFQDFKLLADRTVFENVALFLRILGKKEREIKQEVENILSMVGLTNRADLFPAQLAGGELQRTCIARAIAGNPEIVIADEPTGNLDLTTARQIVNLLKEINKKGKTVIMATHNFEIVNSLNQRVIELDSGRLISDRKKGKYHLP